MRPEYDSKRESLARDPIIDSWWSRFRPGNVLLHFFVLVLLNVDRKDRKKTKKTENMRIRITHPLALQGPSVQSG